jgi:hypothetical protein
MRTFFTLPILLLAAAPAFAQDPLVVLAAARAGRIEFFDETLAPIAGIGVNQLLESVTASPDGRRLYIAQESQRNSGSCCGLFSLDLETKKMCLLATPALYGAPSPDGRFLFTQGKRGVDVFDAATLSRLPTMKAPGAYNLQPSPDGRWLLGVTNSPKPSLDIFDMKSGALARRLSIPAEPATGVWGGDTFYIFSYGDPGKGQLWSVQPEDTELSQAKPIALPYLHGNCNEPVLLMLAGAPDELFLAEAFGFKVDRHLACPDAPGAGVYVIHPSTGRAAYSAPSVRVHRMAASPDGRDLYVLDSGGPSPPGNSRLLHIDPRTGRILHNTALEPGDWNLALAHIPSALIPRRNVHAAASCSR